MAGRDSPSREPPREVIVLLSEDEDDVPAQHAVRTGKRPGEEQQPTQHKRKKLNEIGTSISAPSGLANKGKGKDNSLSQRPTHRPSTSGSSLHQTSKNTVQRTLSSTFKPVSKPRASNPTHASGSSSSSGTRDSSSEDVLPPPSSAFTDILQPKTRKQAAPSKPQSRHSIAGASGQHMTPRIQFPERPVKAGSSSTAKSNFSDPIVIDDSDDDKPKPTPIKPKPPSSASTQRNVASSSKSSSTNKGPPSSIRTPFKPAPPSPSKSGPSTSKPKSPAKTNPIDPNVDIINVDDSEDELLLSPQKPVPKDSIPVASTSAPAGLNTPAVQTKSFDSLPTTLWKSTPQIDKNASTSSTSTAATPRKETSISTTQPRLDLRTVSSRKAPSTSSSTLSSASQTPLSRPLGLRKPDSSISSETAPAGSKPPLDAPMLGIVSASGQQALDSASIPSSKETDTIGSTPRSPTRYHPFGRANMLLRKTNNGQPTASQSSVSSASTTSPSKAGPSQTPSGAKAPPAVPITSTSDHPATSSTALPPGSTPGRPSHSRKSSAEVRKDISGIQDAIDAMGIESSATPDSLVKEPEANDPKTSFGKPTSSSSRDFELPDSLPPVSWPPSPTRPSSRSTPTKTRPASTSQLTVVPTREEQPISSATTAVKKSSRPASPSRNVGIVRSGELDLGDKLLKPLEPLSRLPELVASEPSSKRQESSVPSSKAAPQAPNVEPPKVARPPLPSRSTLKLAQLSATIQQSSQASSSRPTAKGPFSWNPRNTGGDTVDDPETKSAAQSGQSTPLTSPREAGLPLGISVAQRVKDLEKDIGAPNTSAIISGVLDIPTKSQAPMAPPILVPGNVASPSRITEVSSPPLPFLREASSPISQSDPGPPSSRSPSARNSSPDTVSILASTADPSRAAMLPSSPPETSSASPSASDSSAETSSEGPKVHVAHRIARKSGGKQTARKGTTQQPLLSKTGDKSLPIPRKPIGRKSMGGRIPSPLKQVAPSSDHESEYNAASSAEASSHDEQKSDNERRIKKPKPMVQDSSDSDEAAVYESLIDDRRDTSSTNDEAAAESTSGSSIKGRSRPRRAAAKTTPYFVYDQLPSSQPDPVTEPVVASSSTSQPPNDGETGEITVPVKSYGGFQVFSWATFRQDLRNIPMKTYFNKDLPTRLQDQINSWPDYMKQQKDLVTIFRASMIEHTAEDEPNAPIIEIINEFDNEPTPPWEFYYSNHMWYGKDVEPPDLSQLKGCGCVGRCDANPNKCACAQRQASYLPEGTQGFVYDSRGKLKHPGDQWPIFECNKLCGCDDDCQNRVVQNGRKVHLNLQKTQKKGWGVFAGSKRIPAGSFIGIYAGELITNEEAEERGKNYDKFGRTYLLDIDSWHLVQEMGLDVALTVDAFHAGNFTRFLNHSCEPNCYITAVYINQSDIKQPLLVLFSSKDIKPHEEICFSYYGENDDDELNELADVTENDAMFLARCQCGAPTCKGRLWKL